MERRQTWRARGGTANKLEAPKPTLVGGGGRRREERGGMGLGGGGCGVAKKKKRHRLASGQLMLLMCSEPGGYFARGRIPAWQ